MGYELHITRRAYYDDEGYDIGAIEWSEIIKNDVELELVNKNGKYFTNVLSNEGEHIGWLDWSDGLIYTKNPDNLLLKKMLKISKLLGAKIQGDDGEVYFVGDITSGVSEEVTCKTHEVKDIWYYFFYCIAVFNDFWRALFDKLFGK